MPTREIASEDLFLKLIEEFANTSKPEEFKIVVIADNVSAVL